MNPPGQSNPSPRLQTGHIVVLACFVLLVVCTVGLTGYFRLSSETAALSSSLQKAVPGAWHKMIAVHVGGFTTAVVRHGLRFVRMEPEPRAAVEAVRGAEVGIYQVQSERAVADYSEVFQSTDKAMTARGWDRAIGVAQEDNLVAVYVPHKGLSPRKMKCCVMVLHRETLIVASARGNPEPLLALSRDHLQLGPEKHLFALH